MTYQGIVRNGFVRLEPPADLPDGTLVKVEPIQPPQTREAPAGELPALFRMGRTAAKTGMPDLATNLDHYLYGHPKVCDAS